MFASMMAMLREGYLTQVYHIFYFLKYHHNSFIVSDLTPPDIDISSLTNEDWSSTIYGECKEAILDNAHKP